MLVPNLSVDYGVLRAFQQTLLVVAPMMARGAVAGAAAPRVADSPAVARGRSSRSRLLLVLGRRAARAPRWRSQPRLALGNSGIYYDRFYTSDSEPQAIDWLARTRRRTPVPTSKIISNRNVMVKMLAAHATTPRPSPTGCTRRC